MVLEPEAVWLRLRIIRLRTALRYALEPRTQTILREIIADMEERVEQLDAEALKIARPTERKRSSE